jgi:hypothetical protein
MIEMKKDEEFDDQFADLQLFKASPATRITAEWDPENNALTHRVYLSGGDFFLRGFSSAIRFLSSSHNFS